MKKRLKLKEIADMANVSPATVSLVLNNREGVGPERRRQITKILEENGYRVSQGIEPKANKSIHFIKYRKHALLVDGNPGFVNTIIDAVEKECRRQGYNLIMTAYDDTQLDEISELIQQDSTDGVLLLGTEMTAEDIDHIAHVDVPMVIIDNNLPMQEYNCITMNNEEAIFHSVSHLVSLGHPQIGFIANAPALQ